jgi:hypothetical protein
MTIRSIWRVPSSIWRTFASRMVVSTRRSFTHPLPPKTCNASTTVCIAPSAP